MNGRSLADFYRTLDGIIVAAETENGWRVWRPFPGRRVVMWSSVSRIELGEGEQRREWQAVRVEYVAERPRYGYTLTQARRIRDYLRSVMAGYSHLLDQAALNHLSEVIRPADPSACSDHAKE